MMKYRRIKSSCLGLNCSLNKNRQLSLTPDAPVGFSASLRQVQQSFGLTWFNTHFYVYMVTPDCQDLEQQL